MSGACRRPRHLWIKPRIFRQDGAWKVEAYTAPIQIFHSVRDAFSWCKWWAEESFRADVGKFVDDFSPVSDAGRR